MAGAVKVPILGDPREPGNLPYAALGICAAGVCSVQHTSHDLSLTLAKAERSLKLWATGVITIEAVETSHTANKGIVFKPMLNKSSGKVLTTAQAFNEANWGPATRAFIKSSRTLTLDTFKRSWIWPAHMPVLRQCQEPVAAAVSLLLMSIPTMPVQPSLICVTQRRMLMVTLQIVWMVSLFLIVFRLKV